MHESCSCIRQCLCTLCFCRSGSIATGVCKKISALQKKTFSFWGTKISTKKTYHIVDLHLCLSVMFLFCPPEGPKTRKGFFCKGSAVQKLP